MKRPAIIRGIWGTSKQGHCDMDLHGSAKKSLAEPCEAVGVFGKNNRDVLLNLGWPKSKIRVLHSDPKLAPAEQCHWIHKFMIIDHMVEIFGPVLWVDLDVRMVRKPDPWWWSDLSKKAPFRSALCGQRSARKGAWWRDARTAREINEPPPSKAVRGRKAKFAAKLMPGGGCMYVRNREVSSALLQLHQQNPSWSGQQIQALYLDLMNGRRWMGVQRYLERHEMLGYYYPRNVFPGHPLLTYWQCGDFPERYQGALKL